MCWSRVSPSSVAWTEPRVPSSAECRQYNVTGESRVEPGRHLGSCQLDQSQGSDPASSSNHKPPSVPLDWRENLTNRQPYNKMQAEYFYVNCNSMNIISTRPSVCRIRLFQGELGDYLLLRDYRLTKKSSTCRDVFVN